MFFFRPLASVTVIVAFPFLFFAVTFPFFPTFAMLVLLDCQDFTLSPFARPDTSTICDSLACSFKEVVLSWIVGFSFGMTEAFHFSVQPAVRQWCDWMPVLLTVAGTSTVHSLLKLWGQGCRNNFRTDRRSPAAGMWPFRPCAYARRYNYVRRKIVPYRKC